LNFSNLKQTDLVKMPLIGLAYLIYTKVITHAGLIHLYSLIPWWKPNPELDESIWIVVTPSPADTSPVDIDLLTESGSTNLNEP
jgi:hypothetical protein